MNRRRDRAGRRIDLVSGMNRHRFHANFRQSFVTQRTSRQRHRAAIANTISVSGGL